MSKILTTAALVVGVVAITVATAGIGTAPALGAAGAIGGTAAFAGSAAVGASLFGLSVGTLALIASGLSLAAGLLAQKPKTLAGDPAQWKADPFAGVPYQIGRTLNAGNIVKRVTYGATNVYEMFVTIYSLGPIRALGPWFANRTTVTFDGSGNAVGAYHNQIRRSEQLGACPEPAALAVPVGSPPGWDASSKLSGYAASLMVLSYDSKANPPFTSEPQHARIPDGVYVYDPRQDSTYPGGSGACRALNEATYVWSENPALHALTWCLGRWQNGKRVIGLGAPIGQIDVSAFVDAANICDANGWKAGGVVYSRPDTPWNVLKAILQAGSATPIPIGGTISCMIDTPRVSLATITNGDIVGDCSLAATQPRRSRINGVVPRYRSEAHDWTVVAADLVQVASYVTADGGERTKETEYALVQDARQASQLAAYEISNARELGPGTFPLKPAWMNYRVGDCVTIATREIAPLKVMIIGREVDPGTGVVTMTIRSETDAKHAFALGVTGAAPPTATVAPYVAVVTAPGATAWSLSAGTGAVPSLVVTGAADAANADAVIFAYRVSGTSAWSAASREAATITRKEITGLSPGTAYEVSVQYEAKGWIGDPLVLGPATVGALSAASAATAADAALLGGTYGKTDIDDIRARLDAGGL